ncbi:bolA 2 [Sigmodon hispidus]
MPGGGHGTQRLLPLEAVAGPGGRACGGGGRHNCCATSFRVLAVSAQVQEKSLLQRHRLVNECLAIELLRIHAFEQKTLTPEQWTRELRRCGAQARTTIKS